MEFIFGVILQFSAFFIFFPWWDCVLSGLMQFSCHFSNLVLFEELFCVREVKVAKSLTFNLNSVRNYKI